MRKLESMCRKALYEFEMIPPNGKIAVALSGGKDSLTLLHLLKKISGRGFPELELFGVHVAGEFSCGAGVNENFLRGTCDGFGVKLIVRESTQKRETLECYRCSRERRRLIFEAAKEAGATTVAFGHHRDDSIETLIMNLLHKAEFAANLPKVPMHDFGVTIIRPLIFISENEIREFAKQSGFARITCQCPVGQVSLRKQVKDLLVQIEETFPNARENLAQAGLTYGSDKACTNNLKNREFDKKAPQIFYSERATIAKRLRTLKNSPGDCFSGKQVNEVNRPEGGASENEKYETQPT